MIKNNSIHRRRFLAGCVVATGVGLLQLHGALPSNVATRGYRRFTQLTLAMLTKTDFDTCLGTTFQMQVSPEQTAALELIEVSGYPAQAMRSDATREPFSLLFRGAKELQVSQQIFRLNHPELGVHEVFLVPIGPDKQGMRFEAVFS